MSLVTPPLSTEPLHFQFPPTEHVALPDGSVVYVIHRPDEDLMSITVIAHTGCVDDVIPGETAFAASMMSRGTARLSADAFAEEVEYRGCNVSSSADRDSSSVVGVGLKEYALDLVELVYDSAFTPRFDEQEIERQRTVRIADATMNQSDPDWLAMGAEAQIAYSGHPYAIGREGSPSSLRSITRDRMLHVHARFVQARRTVLLTGAFDRDAVLAALIARAKELPASSPSSQAIVRPAPVMLQRTACIAAKDDAVQSALRIGLPMVGLLHPDAFALQLLSSILGGYTMARLFSVLREQKGYTYGAYAYPNVRLQSQQIEIVTSVGNNFTADTIETIKSELLRLHTEPVGAEELNDARQHMLGQFARSNETPQQTAGMVWMRILHGLDEAYYERYIAAIQGFTVESLFDVQQRYFDSKNWVIGASGNRDVLASAVRASVDSIIDYVVPE